MSKSRTFSKEEDPPQERSPRIYVTGPARSIVFAKLQNGKEPARDYLASLDEGDKDKGGVGEGAAEVGTGVFMTQPRRVNNASAASQLVTTLPL